MEHLTADEQVIKAADVRTAILDVIDDGFNGVPWVLYAVNEALARAQRLDFCDRILTRVRELKEQD